MPTWFFGSIRMADLLKGRSVGSEICKFINLIILLELLLHVHFRVPICSFHNTELID